MSRTTFSSDSEPRRENLRDGASSLRQKSTKLATPMRRMRMVALLGMFAFWAVVITGRLVWLQVIQHGEWQERAERQQERTFLVAPRRGILYDRDLHELAMTVTADSVYAVPSEMGSEAEKQQDAQVLAAIVHRDPEDSFTEEKEILARLRDSRHFAWVARKQPPAVIARVKALNLKGIYLQSEFKRFYPDQTLAAQVLGYVGMDDDGLAGVEEQEDHELHGTPGRMLTAVDAKRHVLNSEERDPKPGENLVLTIDANIQFMAEQALEHNMERTGAEHGTVVVQDPHTGQILALAIRPTFNPNDFRYTNPDLLRDRAVSDVYEPGSVFKLVTYSAALDQGVATPDGMVNCLGGSIVVAGRTVHDAPGEHYGVITVTKALEVSSDVGAIQMALRMGKDNFYKYIHAFGFGQRTGIELPGETRGLVKPPSRWQPTTIGSIPMGQEIAVTPIQVATMVSTIANGGMYLPPHIVIEATGDTKASGTLKPVAFHDDEELPNPLPAGAHRVISEMTAAEMRQMMEDVVLYGTGQPAQLDGYSAAGKTGTAQKIDPKTHRYSKVDYIASFAGFAPVNDPAVTIVVVMDSPHKGSHYGTAASAPLFHELAQQILEYLGVPHDQDLKPQPLVAKNKVPLDDDDVPPESEQDLQSLFDEANHLPADDPLSTEYSEQSTDVSGQGAAIGRQGTGDGEREAAAGVVAIAPSPPPAIGRATGSVAIANHQVAVPSFAGKSLREAVVQASAAGLGIQVVGTGIARGQVPAAGTMVPAGTAIVVQFAQ
ncbi:MAG: penicillin-binding protein [Acidobacteriaceae bacterium]